MVLHDAVFAFCCCCVIFGGYDLYDGQISCNNTIYIFVPLKCLGQVFAILQMVSYSNKERLVMAMEVSTVATRPPSRDHYIGYLLICLNNNKIQKKRKPGSGQILVNYYSRSIP
jgi:hypothetical protein